MKSLYEQLKLFYLGFLQNSKTPLVYENKDLTTHALIIGMTGSGKTGLGIDLIEEACIDSIPSFIIDPKGDMGNLLLNFSSFSAEEFLPWIQNPDAKDAKQQAQQIANAWKQGIINSDQDLNRANLITQNADFTIYTPGSSSGVGIALLSDFTPPLIEDYDFLNSYVSSIVTSLLALMDIKSDPISGKEHIFLSSIFLDSFYKKQTLKLNELILQIINPPFEKVGAFSVEQFLNEDKRFELSMKLNTILSSPSFKLWQQGEPLEISNMLYTKEGKAKANIFYIAHLNDKERMFFVTLLLNKFIGWMRTQEGTSRLRTLLYMDEIFGFFPPSQNPPSKQPMLSLLKQARAYGVGVVLSTQNPVDLDYKGLSNIGTWFIGRLQTDQDKQRVISGLSGIAGSSYSKNELLDLLSNIEKRHFLLKNIHEQNLQIFSTRHTLSYLKGPLSKNNIKFLCKDKKSTKKPKKHQNISDTISILPEFITQKYLYQTNQNEYILQPCIFCTCMVNFSSSKYNIEEKKQISFYVNLDEDDIDFSQNENIQDINFEDKPRKNSTFLAVPNYIIEDFKSLEKSFKNYIYHNEKLNIFTCKALKLTSNTLTTKEAFIAQMQDKIQELKNEKLQLEKENLYKKQEQLDIKIIKAEQKLKKEQEDVNVKTTNAIISVGSSILGAIFGKGLFTRSNISKASSSARSIRSTFKEKNDVKLAEENIQNLLEQKEELKQIFQDNIEQIHEQFALENFPTQSLHVKPRRADIYDCKIKLLWLEQ